MICCLWCRASHLDAAAVTEAHLGLAKIAFMSALSRLVVSGPAPAGKGPAEVATWLDIDAGRAETLKPRMLHTGAVVSPGDNQWRHCSCLATSA